MDKKEFLLGSLRSETYRDREWMLRVFSMIYETMEAELPPWHPWRDDKGVWLVRTEEGGEVLPIEGATADDFLFTKKEKMKFSKGEFVGLLQDVETRVTRVVYHYIMKVYPFGNKFPFEDKKIPVSEIEKQLIVPRLTDNPQGVNSPGQLVESDPNKVYVFEHLRFSEAAGGFLPGMTQLFTPSTTRRSLVTDPRVYEVRAQELEKNKDRLHDPAVIAGIKKKLGAIDREWVKGDPSEDYLISGKSFNVVRMKTLLMHGEEYGFGDGTNVTLIPTSLDEGWNLDNLPDYSNSLREGSFNRGYLTMLGGEAVQFLVRVYQNNAITEDDCGSILGMMKYIPVQENKQYIGYYIVRDKKLIELTEENISTVAGTMVLMRSPMFCHTSGAGYCAKCMGNLNARFPNALGSLAADVGSMMLFIFMKKAHAVELRTTHYDPMVELH